MDFDRKTIFAFVLIGLVLIFVQTPFYKKAFFPEQYKQEQIKKLEKQNNLTQGVINEKVSQPSVSENSATQTDPVVKQKADTISVVNGYDLGLTDSPEKLYTIENNLIKAIISSKGATLRKWYLKKYPGPDENPAQLLPEEANGTLGLSFITKEGDTLNTAHWSFNSNSFEKINLADKESQKIVFQCDLKNGKRIIKEFTFYQNNYHIDMNVTLEKMGDIISEKAYFIDAPDGLASVEKRLHDDMYYAKAAVAGSGEVSKKFKPNGKVQKESGSIDWVGVRTKYFALAIVPKTRKGIEAQVVGHEIQTIPNEKTKWKKYAVRLTMPFLKDDLEKDKFLIYMGPLDDEIVKSYDIGLENIMDFGFVVIQPFSKAILWSFKKLHTVIPNYGIVLILFSIMIKVIVYPLTHKSYASMQKMQALQPKLAEIKEKYGKDPQRMNAETMKMYKETGVNPAGGCLPMLLQMPLLWGLFIVFRSTIELRGQGFIWWIKDLSIPDTVATLPFSLPMYGDTVNILPLFMGLTMLIQQKLSVTDPKQKMMVYFMPLFLTLLFNQFPSGLNLYYALFNLLSIIQQKWLVNLHKKPQPAIATISKKRKKI